MSLQTSCSDLGGVRSSRHPGALRSWPPHILEVCGVRPILEVCGVRLTPVVFGVGLHRPWNSDDRVFVSVPLPVAWLLYEPSRLPLLEARAACGARVVRMRPAPALEALNLISLAMDTPNPILYSYDPFERRPTNSRGYLTP